MLRLSAIDHEGISRVGGYVEVALTLLFLIAAASYWKEKSKLAGSMQLYANH